MTGPATVVFFGDTFTLNPEVSEFALMEFAYAGEEGQDGDTRVGLASILRLVKECVPTQDWARFRALARANKAGVTDLLPVLKATFAQAADRPTGGLSDSTDGPAATPPNSVSTSASTVTEMFPGRPDKAMAVLRATRSA